MRLRPLLILALAGLVHALLLIGWRWPQPVLPYFFDATVLSGGRGLDFYAIYQAGYNARHGLDMYETDPGRVPVVVPYFTPYRYLPVVAGTLGVLLSLLSPLSAYKLWVVLVELTLLACVYFTWRRAAGLERFALPALMWLAFSPYYLELFMGQFSLVQAALIFGLLLGAEARPVEARWVRLWIVSLLWKVNTVVLLPVLLRLRRFRTILLAAALGTLVSLPYFALFPAHLGDFLANNLGGAVRGHELGNLGLRQLVFEVLATLHAPAEVQQAAQGLVLAAVLGAALALTFLPRRQPDIVDLFSLWLTAFFLVSHQVWEHHYVMLLPVVVLAWLRRPGLGPLLVWLLLALPTPFGFSGLQPVIAANHDLRAFRLEPAWQPLLQHLSKPLPSLVLFLWLGQKIVQAAPRRG